MRMSFAIACLAFLAASGAQAKPIPMEAIWCNTKVQMESFFQHRVVDGKSTPDSLKIINDEEKEVVCGLLNAVIEEGTAVATLKSKDGKSYAIMSVTILAIISDGVVMRTEPTPQFGLKPLVQPSSIKETDA